MSRHDEDRRDGGERVARTVLVIAGSGAVLLGVVLAATMSRWMIG